MIHAFVLIKAEREAMHSLGGKLADVEGVTEAYSITGEWDSGGSAPYIRPSVGTPPDYSRSDARDAPEMHTMVAFEVYSQHDLEAMFSIGA
jgi:hypothetical protein